MKLIQISDIHGDMEMVERGSRLVEKAIGPVDAFFLTGDLSDRRFNSKELNYAQNLKEKLATYLPSDGKVVPTIGNLSVLAARMLRKPDGEGYGLAKDWLELVQEGDNRAKAQYKEMEERFAGLAKCTYLIPGETDNTNLFQEPGEKDDLEQVVLQRIREHLDKTNKEKVERVWIKNKTAKKQGDFRIVGYGGEATFSKRAYDHLMREYDPNIALVHSLCETCTPEQSLVKRYLNQRAPDLVLTGHTHECNVPRAKDKGSIKEILYPGTKSVVLDAGSLGRVPGKDFGTLLEVDIDDNCFVRGITRHDILGAHDAKATIYGLDENFYK